MRTILITVLFLVSFPAVAQNHGEPGKFDFYLMNLAWSADFCHIKDVGPQCVPPQTGFVLHGLWAQNNNGTYPVFCGDRPGPAHPERNLDLTPDLVLLDHEWKKHGTCTTLAPERFFAAERRAFSAVRIPSDLAELDHSVALRPADVLGSFNKMNPGLPMSSLVLWCSAGKLTSVSVCLSKDLRPIACRGLKSCVDETIEIAPPSAGPNLIRDPLRPIAN